MKNKNTYSLIAQSEEKGRSIFEAAIYGVVIVCTAFSGWQFASHSVVLPGMNRSNNATELVVHAPADQPVAAANNVDASAL
jgi:hypothetical protein